MEIIVEILFSFIGDLLLQLLFEILIELGYSSIVSSFKRQNETNKVIALFGCLLLGVIFGYLSFLVYPHRIVQVQGIPGLSLILVPLAAGVVMHRFGEWKRQQGKQTSTLATFWGGTIFAFASSLIRFLALTYQ